MICKKFVYNLAVKTATTQTKSGDLDFRNLPAKAGFVCVAATYSRQIEDTIRLEKHPLIIAQ